MLVGGARFGYRFLRLYATRHHLLGRGEHIESRVMIIGAGSAGEKILRETLVTPKINKEVVCFIDDDLSKKGRRIHNVPVVGGKNEILQQAEKYHVDEIYIALPSIDDKEVSEIPMNQILNQALQWAAKEQGGGSQTRWLDANGKVTDDITKSVTGEIYSHTKGNWQRLSKAKLAEAVKAVIENTPGAKASLEQDYKIAKWKYDQNGSNPDITDKNGILLTPEQYLAKRIDPFYNAATFYNQDSNTTYGEAWKAQLALSKQAGSGSSAQRKQAIDNLTYKGTPVRIDNFMPAQAQAEITSNRQSIAGLLNKYNPDINIDLVTANPNDIRTSIMTNITSPSDRAYALSYLNDIIDNQEYINSLKVGKSQDSIDGFDTYNSIIKKDAFASLSF